MMSSLLPRRPADEPTKGPMTTFDSENDKANEICNLAKADLRDQNIVNEEVELVYARCKICIVGKSAVLALSDIDCARFGWKPMVQRILEESSL